MWKSVFVLCFEVELLDYFQYIVEHTRERRSKRLDYAACGRSHIPYYEEQLTFFESVHEYSS